MNIRYLATVDGPKWTRSDAPQRPTGSKGGVAERRETFWRPRDLVHILYAYRCRRRGVHGDDQTWSSIMPVIFDVLYREFCRARLAEMRKQLLLWPGWNSNSHVQMMKSAEKWRRQNATNGMYYSRRRRVLVDR